MGNPSHVEKQQGAPRAPRVARLAWTWVAWQGEEQQDGWRGPGRWQQWVPRAPALKSKIMVNRVKGAET